MSGVQRSRLFVPRADGGETLTLPAVEAAHLDAVVNAAGPRLLPAIAVLVSALGWYLARGFARPADAARLARAVPPAVAAAVAFHAEARGHG